MKKILILPFLTALCSFADETASLGVVINDLPDPSSIRFTPPEPPKEIPSLDVQGATSVRFPTHRITILRGEASPLPDLPAATEEVQVSTVEDSSRKIADPVIHASISVSVLSDDLCRVEVFNPRSQTHHTAWCGWDVSILAPVSQITVAGKVHEISIYSGPATLQDLPADTVRPRVGAGTIHITDGDVFTSNLLIALRDVLGKQRRQLLAIRAAQEQYAKDAEEWRKAHPPQPEDHTIWFRPHRGSRYLTEEGGDQ